MRVVTQIFGGLCLNELSGKILKACLSTALRSDSRLALLLAVVGPNMASVVGQPCVCSGDCRW